MDSIRNIAVGLKFRTPKSDRPLQEAILDALEEGYLKQRRESKFTKKVTFAPSGINEKYDGSCPRRWVLAFQGAHFEENTDAVGVATMANGTAAHERLQKALEVQGSLVDSEVEITMIDPPIRGFADAILDIDGEEIIGEFKTTRSEAFVYRSQTGKPDPAHFVQLMIYLKATGRETGFILYENRNDQTVYLIIIHKTEENLEKLEEVLSWLREVYKAYQDDKIPAPVYQKRNKICAGCPVFEKCWNPETPVDIDIPRLILPKL